MDKITEMSQPRTWAIGQLASEFEVTSRALRLYEEEGLLKPRRAGTRRIYSERWSIHLENDKIPIREQKQLDVV